MIKKLVIVLALSVFGLTQYAAAEKDYALELKSAEEKLSALEAGITEQKLKIEELMKEFNDSDIALRQDLIAIKPTMNEKAYIRESKRRQTEFRQDFDARIRPVKQEYARSKVSRRKYAKKIRLLKKRIDRLANDPEAESYNKKIDELKGQIQDAKDEMNKAVAAIYKKADNDIAQIEDMANKSSIKSGILSESRVKALAVRKEYKAKKEAIVERMDKITSDYKKNLDEFRAGQAEASRAGGTGVVEKSNKQDNGKPAVSGPAVNFSPVR
jgi:uncharacterized protein YhaN